MNENVLKRGTDFSVQMPCGSLFMPDQWLELRRYLLAELCRGNPGINANS